MSKRTKRKAALPKTKGKKKGAFRKNQTVPIAKPAPVELDEPDFELDSLSGDELDSLSEDEQLHVVARRPSNRPSKGITTFQNQMNLDNVYNRNNERRYSGARNGQRNSLLQGLHDEQAEAQVVQKLRELEQSGNKVLDTLTAVFGSGKSGANSNWHRDGGQPKDVRQILEEAEADQKYKKLKRNSRIIIQIQRSTAAVLPRTLIHPETEWRSWWDMFMLLLVSYYAVVTPINIAFDKSPFNLMPLELLFNTFFVLDIVLQFFTSYKHDKGPNAGRLETSHAKVVRAYLSRWFLVDVLASFPIDIILAAASSGPASASGNTLNRLLRLVRSVKLMRILRMSRIWKRLLLRARLNPSVVRLVKLFGFLLIEWHWIGCTYWAIAVSEGFEKDETQGKDAWTPTMAVDAYSFGSQYVRAYFWAVMVTTGVGKDIIPVTDVQFIFTTMAIIVGVLMYALIVGSVGTALSSIDTPDSQRRRRMDAVREYLRQRDISEALTEKVLNYYDYCYTRHISQHDEAILEDIHSALKEKLDLEMNQQLLQKVPRFQQLPDQLLLILIHSLISRIYLPNELVFMIGERASEMFFVARGDLEVLCAKGGTTQFLSDGASFGDQLFQNNARRTNTVRAVTHCELLILTKDSLRKIMKLFPEFAMMVQKWSGQQKWQSIKGWERVQYAVKTLRTMRLMGSEVSFPDVMRHLNGFKNDDETLHVAVDNEERRKTGLLSYDQFKDDYACAFTKVQEQMEHSERKKLRLKKLKLKKRRQQKIGKMSVLLGENVLELPKKRSSLPSCPAVVEEEEE